MTQSSGSGPGDGNGSGYRTSGPWSPPGSGYPGPPPPPPRRQWGAGRIVLVTLAGMILAIGVVGVALLPLLGPLAPQNPQDAERDARGRVIKAATVDKNALRPGDCVNDEALRELELGDDMQTMSLTAEVVPCARRHDFEVTAAFTLPDGDYSEASNLRQAVNQGCVRRLQQAWSQDRPLLRDKVLAYYLPPVQATQQDKTVCMLQLASGKQMQGTIR